MAYWVYTCHLSYMPEIANGFSQTDWNCHAIHAAIWHWKMLPIDGYAKKKSLSVYVNVKHKVQW